MATQPTYQVLVDDIKMLGVEQVFGLMSDDTAHDGLHWFLAVACASHPRERKT